jgi:uncharacterized membrane protein YbhN (UPF0104 family)
MAVYQEWWFIVTLIAAIIFAIIALLYVFWVDQSQDTPWWVWAGVILSLILIVVAFVIYVIERAKKEKMALTTTPKWVCQPVCSKETIVKIEKAMCMENVCENPEQDTLFPSWMR